MSQWCKIVEQGNITLNLLRPSRLNPKLSAYAQVLVAFDYQKTILPPPGMKLRPYVITINRHLFDMHVTKGLYVGIAMKH